MMVSPELRITLLISFVFHLFCALFVSITFLPSGYKMRQYSSVIFFGSILSTPIFVEQASSSKKKDIAKLPAEADIQKSMLPFSERPGVSLLLEKEALDPDEFVDIDRLKDEPPSFTNFVSTRLTPQREIIFKPPLPQYPEWRQQEEKGAFAIFKIYISADGLVEHSICMQGSGNPEIDAALARYIRRWRFAPVLRAKLEMQTVKINLDR